MSRIIWTSYQDEHITQRHDVSEAEFSEAWQDRDDLAHKRHPTRGDYYEGTGLTDSGRGLYLVWRWQVEAGEIKVWPITAYEVPE